MRITRNKTELDQKHKTGNKIKIYKNVTNKINAEMGALKVKYVCLMCNSCAVSSKRAVRY